MARHVRSPRHFVHRPTGRAKETVPEPPESAGLCWHRGKSKEEGDPVRVGAGWLNLMARISSTWCVIGHINALRGAAMMRAVVRAQNLLSQPPSDAPCRAARRQGARTQVDGGDLEFFNVTQRASHFKSK